MGTPSRFSSRRKSLLLVPLAVLLVVWMSLYLPHLRTLPAWYGDETLTLMIGRSLFSGTAADRSFKATFWHPSYAYQPGYAWAAGAAAALTGGDISGARALNTLMALAIALSIYLAGRRPLGHAAALGGGCLFLVYSQSIIHFRWVYSHNAVALGFLIAVLALLRKSRPRPDWTAGGGLALAALSHPLFAHGAFAAWLCRLLRPRAWFRMAIPPALVLAGSLGLTLWATWPHRWLQDDMATLVEFYAAFSRENGGGLAKVFQNVRHFYMQDWFHLGAMLGIVLCVRRRFYPIAIFAVVVSGLLLQNRQNLPIFYYQAVVFLPVLALAWAGGAATAAAWLRRRAPRLRHLPAGVLLAVAAIAYVFNVKEVWTGTLQPRNQPWVTQDTREVEEAAAWVNAHTTPDDFVIAHQNIGWLLHAKTADFMQAAAWSGLPTFTFENVPPHERFHYPADLGAARYAIVADIDQRWTFGQPHLEKIVQRLQDEKWLVVWSGRNYVVLENPSRHSASPSP